LSNNGIISYVNHMITVLQPQNNIFLPDSNSDVSLYGSHLPYNLYCVGGDVKHSSLTHCMAHKCNGQTDRQTELWQ